MTNAERDASLNSRCNADDDLDMTATEVSCCWWIVAIAHYYYDCDYYYYVTLL